MGITARSWNSRIENDRRPWRVVSSLRSASACKAKAVEDRDRASPATTAASSGSPNTKARPASTRAVKRDLPAAEPKYRPAHGPEAARLQLETDDEEQEDDAELGEMKDLPLVVHQVQRPGADDQACQHVAEDRAHSGPAGKRDDNHGRGEKDGNLFEKRHATHPFPIQPRPVTRFLFLSSRAR